MYFDDYQSEALETRTTPIADSNVEVARFALGTVDEAGEVAGAVKKYFRGDYGPLNSDEAILELRRRVKNEAGDTLWYLAVLLDTLGLDMGDVAAHNAEKLARRREENKIRGDGSDR